MARVAEIIGRCSKCGVAKPAYEFHASSVRATGLSNLCKGCDRKKGRAYYAANRDSVLARQRTHYSENTQDKLDRGKKYRDANSDRINGAYRARYKTPEKKIKVALAMSRANAKKHGNAPCCVTYDELLPTLVDYCQLCGKTDCRMCLDHCHETGAFRGWLCSNCNTGMGMLQESPELMRKCITYLGKT